MISSGDKNGRTLEVAHEALFRAWPRLADDWLKENKAFLVWQQRLSGAIKQYEDHKRNHDFLLRGFPLTEALEWLKKNPDAFSAREHQFVTASKTHVMRRRWLTAAIAVVLLIVVGGPLAWLESQGVTVRYARSIVMARLHLVSVVEPEPVMVSGGSYQQGDIRRLGSEDEQSVQEVTIKPFVMGKYEVTFQEYDR